MPSSSCDADCVCDAGYTLEGAACTVRHQPTSPLGVPHQTGRGGQVQKYYYMNSFICAVASFLNHQPPRTSWCRAHQNILHADGCHGFSPERPRMRNLKEKCVPWLCAGVRSWIVQERERVQRLPCLRGIPSPLHLLCCSHTLLSIPRVLSARCLSLALTGNRLLHLEHGSGNGGDPKCRRHVRAESCQLSRVESYRLMRVASCRLVMIESYRLVCVKLWKRTPEAANTLSVCSTCDSRRQHVPGVVTWPSALETARAWYLLDAMQWHAPVSRACEIRCQGST